MSEPERPRVRVLILTGLGLNCEAETAQAFRLCGATPELVHLTDLDPRRLVDYQVIAMIGGFSYGDHVGAGALYANRLRCRLLDGLLSFIAQGGLMIGICNGFQAMVRLGLLPGLDGDYRTQRVTLTANDRAGYWDGWVKLHAEGESRCVWTRGIRQIELPVRHAEGRFLAESPAVLERLEAEGLVALRYDGENPNGSRNAVAGICDPTGRILGLMPHPEAYLYGVHHPRRERPGEEGEGVRIFRNGVDAACGE